jgi:hypothetical protein
LLLDSVSKDLVPAVKGRQTGPRWAQWPPRTTFARRRRFKDVKALDPRHHHVISGITIPGIIITGIQCTCIFGDCQIRPRFNLATFTIKWQRFER